MFRWHSIFLILWTVSVAPACHSDHTTPTSPSAPPPPAPNSTINYAAIGASDAVGYGSSVVCIPFVDCPNGKGYVPEATRQLQSKGFTVVQSNLGIPTAVIGRDFQALGAQYGRDIFGNFIDSEAPFVSVKAPATLVTIFAGANDVNTVTAALGQGAGGSDQVGYINAQVKAFGDDYATLLKIIRGIAPSARIVALNLPNLAGLPYLAGASLQQRQAAQRLSVGITTQVVNPLVSQEVIVIDLMCDARSYQTGTYSGDGFHPNDAGYLFLAGEVVAAATTNYRTPARSCSYTNIVPN